MHTSGTTLLSTKQRNSRFLRTLTLIIILLQTFYGTAQNPNQEAYLIHDNDFLKLTNSTDRYYSFGLTSGYQKILHKVHFLQPAGTKPINYRTIGGVELSIKGYTPNPEVGPERASTDRPFAGTLTLQPYLASVSNNRFIKLNLELGVRGPASQAGDFQNWVHEKIGDDPVAGWENQLHNKMLINAYGLYAKPFYLFKNLDLVSESSAAAGNHFTYLQQGMKLRFGWFNDISSSATYGTVIGSSVRSRPEFFSAFTLFGRIALVDATLSRSVLTEDRTLLNRENLLAGYATSIHYSTKRIGIVVSYHKISPATQLSEKHSYGSISFNYRW